MSSQDVIFMYILEVDYLIHVLIISYNTYIQLLYNGRLYRREDLLCVGSV